MRRGIIIGLFVSICFHAGLATYPILWAFFFPPKAKAVSQTQAVELSLWVPPPLPDVPPDPTDPDQDKQQDISTLAPPTIMDVPGDVKVDSFTEIMAPPPPPNMGTPDPNMRVVPTGNFAANRPQGNLSNVFDIKDLDQIPQERGIRASPVFPSEMKRQGISGDVVLRFVVEIDGSTSNITIVSSSNREFETPAIQAVQKWRFRPGRKAGKDVRTNMQVPISFTLSDED